MAKAIFLRNVLSLKDWPKGQSFKDDNIWKMLGYAQHLSDVARFVARAKLIPEMAGFFEKVAKATFSKKRYT